MHDFTQGPAVVELRARIRNLRFRTHGQEETMRNPARRLPLASTLAAALSAAVALAPAGARAGNSGFFTTYDSGVERGEFELMLMNDLTRPSPLREGYGVYASHMFELEYGVTSKLAAELMLEWFEDFKTGEAAFTGYRVEARYRLFENPVPLNPMLYVEYEDLAANTRYKMETSGFVKAPYAEDESEGGRERVLETRLVLSEQIGPFNLAFNWINETDLHDAATAFGYALGAMWMPGHGEAASCPMPAASGAQGGGAKYSCPMHRDAVSDAPGTCPQCGMALAADGEAGPSSACGCAENMKGCGCAHCAGRGGACSCKHGGMWGLGLEAFGGLGDTKAFGVHPSLQEHYLGVIAMYHFTPRLMMHAQLAKGLTSASDDLLRLNVGYEF